MNNTTTNATHHDETYCHIDILSSKGSFRHKVEKADHKMVAANFVSNASVLLDNIDVSILNVSPNLTRIINPVKSFDEKILSNVFINEAEFSFNRNVFSRLDGVSRQARERGTKEFTSADKPLFLRTRVNMKTAHIVTTTLEQKINIEDIPLDSPFIIRTMSNSDVRADLMQKLVDVEFQRKLAQWLAGSGRDVVKGTKRYTMSRLYRKIGHLLQLEGDPLDNAVLLTAGRLIHAVLEQFDWKFTTVSPDLIIEPTSRLMTKNDIENLYVEGWMAKHIPSQQYWVTKYAGSEKITIAALEETLTSSFINLKRQLMEATLLVNRVRDVVNLAELKAAIDMGLIPTLGNETLAAVISSSPDLADMATWACIVGDMVSTTSVTKLNAGEDALRTKIGDIGLFTKHISDVSTCVREHKLVSTVNVGDLVNHISSHKYTLGDDGVYHVALVGSLQATKQDYYHYIEEQTGTNLFSHYRIRENDAVTLATSKVVSEASSMATKFLLEQAGIYAHAQLDKMLDPDNMWGNAPCFVTVLNVTTEELRLLALLNSDIVVEYDEVADLGDLTYVVTDVYYVIPESDKLLCNPFPLLGSEVYTKSAIIAAVLNTNKMGTGPSFIIDVGLDNIKSHFMVKSLSDTAANFITTNVPRKFSSILSIEDSAKRTHEVTVHTLSSNYLVMNPSGDVISFIPDTLMAQTSHLIYALNAAVSEPRFKNSQIAGYEVERSSANFLASIYDRLLSINIAKQISIDVRYDVARQLSNVLGAWSRVYHNINVQVLSDFIGATSSLRYLLSFRSSDDDGSLFNWFNDAFSTNRLFRDVALGKVVR